MPSNKIEFTKVDSIPNWIEGDTEVREISANVLSQDNWTFPDRATSSLMSKLRLNSLPLEKVTKRIFQGLKTSADKIYILEGLGENEESIHLKCLMNGKEYTVEKELFHPLIKGGNSKGYVITHDDLFVLFPYKNGSLISEKYIQKNLPLTYSYLLDHREYLENRENGRMKNKKWYGYIYPKSLKEFGKSKLFTPDISPEPAFGLDEQGKYYFTGGVSGGYGIIPIDFPIKALLGILNSRVSAWYIYETSTPLRGGWYSYESKYIKSLPIPKIKSKEAIQLESYVAQIIKMKEEETKCDISSIKAKIDQLVYELYNLTEEEIGLIETGSQIS